MHVLIQKEAIQGLLNTLRASGNIQKHIHITIYIRMYVFKRVCELAVDNICINFRFISSFADTLAYSHMHMDINKCMYNICIYKHVVTNIF